MDSRSVVITGSSRGLGLATAALLYRNGWTVIAAMRSPEAGLASLRAITGAAASDPRLIGVQIDVTDDASIAAAAAAITDAVGAPYAIVHNAGIAAVGGIEEMPQEVWDSIFATNFFGPVKLTRALVPSMREAGRGRIVMVSSQGAVRGMPGIGAYSAAKGALERWAESLSQEIAAFGLGVTVLVAGSFKTDILELTVSYADMDGPYATHHENIERNGRRLIKFAAKPERFAPAVAKALEETAPYARHGVGIDAHLILLGNRMLPGRLLLNLVGRALGIPKPGSMSSRRPS